MSRNFLPIRSKAMTFDISSVRREFLGVIGESYMIRVSTNQKNFYIMPNLPNKILVSVKALRASLTLPLDPSIMSYLNSFSLTRI